MFSVETGSVWKHLKRGHLYIVVGDCLIENGVVDAVLYRRCDGEPGPVWCRPLSEFADGRFVRITAADQTSQPPCQPND